MLRMADELGGRVSLKGLSARDRDRKHQWILDYLKKDPAPVLEKYRNASEASVYCPDAPIWVCWWTGEETAPALVKRCVSSIRENAGTHPVHMITKENYGDYLDIPPHILEKV